MYLLDEIIVYHIVNLLCVTKIIALYHQTPPVLQLGNGHQAIIGALCLAVINSAAPPPLIRH